MVRFQLALFGDRAARPVLDGTATTAVAGEYGFAERANGRPAATARCVASALGGAAPALAAARDQRLAGEAGRKCHSGYCV